MKTSLDLFLSAKEYYLELFENFQRARESIFIIGWDIHSSVDLLPQEHDNSTPKKLHLLLKMVANKNKNLKIYILPWEYAFFYKFERDFFLEARFKWISPKNIKFETDGTNPIGASHHQKIVLIDDSIAYCGGIDLTVHRWDDKNHDPNNPDRVLLDGSSYPPYHDLQLRIQGELVNSFSKIVRDRYKNATGINVEYALNPNSNLIKAPGIFPIDSINSKVIQTRPVGTFGTELREIEEHYIDLISNAKKYLYIENQYLTSDIITNTLKSKLQQKDCPEILILLPKSAGAWLELETMGRLQAEKCLELSQADINKKLLILYPDDDRLKDDDYIVVHSKLMIADHKRFIIGSANLTNRSLGLDTECSVYTEGRYKNLFFTLLSMFCDLTATQISNFFDEDSSYFSLIKKINKASTNKHLRTLNIYTLHHSIPDEFIPDKDYLDQSRPIVFDQELNIYNKAIKKKWNALQKITQNWGLTVTIFVGIAMVIFWYYLPRDFITNPDHQLYYRSFLDSRYNILFIWLVYFISGILFIPINLLILLTASFFPPLQAFLYILTGTQFFCLSTYLMGHILRKFRKYKTHYDSNKIVKALTNNSLLTFVFIRILPIAPSTVIGMVAGYLKASFFKFQLGSAIGIIPGTIALIFFQKSLAAMITDSSWENLFIFISVIIFLACTYKLARKRFAGYL